MIEMGLKAHNEVVWVWRRACVLPSLSLSPLHLTASRSSLSLTTSWIHMCYGIHMAFSWTNRAQTKPCVYQEPGERSSVLTSEWVRIPCENPGVSGGSMGQHFGLRPNSREGTQPPPLTKYWIKDYWAWPCPSEQDPVSPIVTVSHQEASITLLSLFIRGQTEWKPQSHKINQTDPMDYSLV